MEVECYIPANIHTTWQYMTLDQFWQNEPDVFDHLKMHVVQIAFWFFFFFLRTYLWIAGAGLILVLYLLLAVVVVTRLCWYGAGWEVRPTWATHPKVNQLQKRHPKKALCGPVVNFFVINLPICTGVQWFHFALFHSAQSSGMITRRSIHGCAKVFVFVISVFQET